MNTPIRARHAARGFSMIELLVTIVLAGIVLSAMVALFANVLKRTSGDSFRATATNIAQDRIEQVRLLSYPDITQDNLNNPPSPASEFGDGRFGPIYMLAGSSTPYHITYTVVPLDDQSEKKVTVDVKWSDTDFTTTMQTIVKDPTPNTLTIVSGPTPSPLPITDLTITVSFKDWQHVTSEGVTVQRVQTNVTPNVTTTPPPTKLVPNASSTTVTWTGLTGGLNYVYTVTCHSQYGTFTSPAFHLLKSARLKFDTHPGGS